MKSSTKDSEKEKFWAKQKKSVKDKEQKELKFKYNYFSKKQELA